MKVKKGDLVKILSGKDRDKRGKILKTFPQKGKVLVEGLNLVKKHQKAARRGEKGERISLSMPIDVSNVQLICPKCSKTTRIGIKLVDKNKFRICKKCGAEI
mgnify:CR=1 FL=1